MQKEFHILCTAEIPHPGPSENKGICWHQMPFIEIKQLRNPALQAQLKLLLPLELEIIFSSKQAVLAVSALLDYFPEHWTANVLQGATQETFVRLYPNARMQAIGYYARELADFIRKEKPDSQFVFFCGDRRRDTIPNIFRSHQINYREIKVYQTRLKSRKLSQKYDGVIFFSPSAVESYFSLNHPQERTVLFAIGKTTAEAITRFWKGKIICPAFPDKREMINAVEKHFNTYT